MKRTIATLLTLAMLLSTVALSLVSSPRVAHAGYSPSPVWQDEFGLGAGAAVNSSKWAYEVGGGGWGNSERQYYTSSTSNSYHDGAGNLVIEARQGSSGYSCWYGPCEYTSARLRTRGLFQQEYGRFEARIKIPQGNGTWPAFWMLGDNYPATEWPYSGEIDIMEIIGREPNKVHGTLHGPGYSGCCGLSNNYTLPSGSFYSDFHIFSVEWEPGIIRWYVDGINYSTRTPADMPAGSVWVYEHPFYMLLNFAVGGNWPGSPDASTVWPQKMLIDYVRVYSFTPTAPTPTPVPGNPINNPGFESGALGSYWKGWNGGAGASVALASGQGATGAYAARLTPATSWASVEQDVGGLSPSRQYTLRARLKVGTAGEPLTLGVKHYGGAELSQSVSSSGYTQATITFTTGASDRMAVIYCSKGAGGDGFCDDFELVPGGGTPANTPTNTAAPAATSTRTSTPIPPTSTPAGGGGCGTGTNLLTNPGFEAGGLSPWTLATGNGGASQARVHSGAWGSYVGSGLGRLERAVTGLAPSTTYTLCGWFTLEATGSTVQLGVKNHGGTTVTRTVTTSGSFVWVQLALSFTTGAGSTSATIFFEQPTAGGNYGYADDWWLS
jgi:beta-glucanase (GH16 family)